MPLTKGLAAELLGTFWLVLGGCGSAALGAGALYLIASGRAGIDLAAGFASNGFAEHSPGGYSMSAGIVYPWVAEPHPAPRAEGSARLEPSL